MSDRTINHRWSIGLMRADGEALDAGDVRAMLTEVVECHPEDQAHLWGRGLTRGTVPPTALIHVGNLHVTLTWDDGHLATYDAAYDAEKKKRDNQQAQDTLTVQSSGTSDSV